jgi:hypothetical protein
MSEERFFLFSLAVALSISFAGCSRPATTVTELKHYPADDLQGVISTGAVTLDGEVSSDGKGALRIRAAQPTTVRLYETGDLDVENARLTYEAKIRTEGVSGQVYLEMWCQFTGKGEFFSRDLSTPLTGTTEWSTEETPFFLRQGENPDNVKLNLVIEGAGTVWIDDIRLLKGPLP